MCECAKGFWSEYIYIVRDMDWRKDVIHKLHDNSITRVAYDGFIMILKVG